MDAVELTRAAQEKFAPMLRNSERLNGLVSTHDIQLSGVPVRVYEPKVTEKPQVAGGKQKRKKLSPGMVYYHGGGWTIGSVGRF